MDEWAVRRAVMKTGLEGKKVKVRCRRGNVEKKRENMICGEKRTETERCGER